MKALAVVEKAATHPGREQLAEAHRAREAAESALEKAKSTLEKAQRGVQDAELDLETCSGLDERLARARADMVKHGKSGPLPSSLISERTQRNGAKERLEESKGALTLLEAE